MDKSISPLDIQFNRKAVRRLVFDESQSIPISTFHPEEVVNLSVEFPAIPVGGGKTEYSIVDGQLQLTAEASSESSLWLGGFNPFSTFDISITKANKAQVGVEFASPDNKDRLCVLADFNNDICQSISFIIILDHKEIVNQRTLLKEPIEGSFVFRVQSMGVQCSVFAVQNGISRVLCDIEHFETIDLRKKEYFRNFEYRLHSRIDSEGSVIIENAGAYLTTGAGQADICAITHKDGSPFLDRGRLWFTMTVRGRMVGTGVFSLNPSVFDIRLEGMIVMDRGDDYFRNEIGCTIYYDSEDQQWRGLCCGFSDRYVPGKKQTTQLWAISSGKDPRFGFSVMNAKPVDIPNSAEDPHILFDEDVRKWRVLCCTRTEGFKAGLYESDQWDGPYTAIAGPVEVDSTGCLIQKFGEKYYCILGSGDREFYVYSYPDLTQLGTLSMFRKPWDNKTGTRSWPNIIPLPEGYPAPYIALSMDRIDYPGLGHHTYSALYLYHGFPY